MTDRIKVELGKVQETLLLPLWGRAVESRKQKPRLVDSKAVEIVGRIDYDFSEISGNISPITQLAWVARCLHIDKAVTTYLKRYPEATIVNLGCGLDTTFERVDNGKIRFIDLDLPDVIELRKRFFTDEERRVTISYSLFDKEWFHCVGSTRGLMFLAAGVLYYFDEKQVREFMISLADNFPNSELLFDSASPLGVRIANERVIRDGGMDETAALKWGIRSARELENWDRRIRLIDEIPMFRGFKKGFSLKVRYGLMMSDLLNIMSMVHLKIAA